jgi:hypothetical protein
MCVDFRRWREKRAGIGVIARDLTPETMVWRGRRSGIGVGAPHFIVRTGASTFEVTGVAEFCDKDLSCPERDAGRSNTKGTAGTADKRKLLSTLALDI